MMVMSFTSPIHQLENTEGSIVNDSKVQVILQPYILIGKDNYEIQAISHTIKQHGNCG